MTEQIFDVVFLGGGPAGYQGAIRVAQLGGRAAVIEDAHLGGVCLNRGCIPTKTIRASAELLQQARRGRELGIGLEVTGVDMAAVTARKDKVVGMLRGGIGQLLKANGIKLYRGRGRVKGPGEIEVQGEDGAVTVRAKNIVLATGSRPARPGIFTRKIPGLLTTDEILDLTSVPATLLVVGGGAVGVELASIMAAFGSSVTLVEIQDCILPGEDREMAELLQKMLKRRKIKVLTGTSASDISGPGEQLKVTLTSGQTLEVENILLAAGRVPNTEDIGLENLGLTAGGPVAVDNRMATVVPGVYAAGDLVGGWLLAHVAFAEGIVAAENAMGVDSRMDYRAVPSCIFTIPKYAAVGLSEEEAREKSGDVKTAVFPFKSLGMAQATGEWEGQVKMVVEAGSGQLLGCQIIGANAADLVAQAALAMQHKVSVHGIVGTIFTHPTMSEAILETAQHALGRAMHILPDAK